MKKFALLGICVALSLSAALLSFAEVPTPTQAPALSHESVENLVAQMNANMNSRLPYRIKSFFEYYMSPGASIHKKSILVSPGDLDNPQSMEDIDYTRDQYIKAVSKIVTVRGEYTYMATLGALEVSPDGKSATMSIGIEETSVIRTSDDYSNPPTYVRNFVATNCNYTLVGGGTVPIITGANCIEKIVFE